MKSMKHIKLMGMLAVTAIFSSCGKDFLERYPTASVSPPTFFTTEADFKAYTNQFYTFFPAADFLYNESADNVAKSSVDREIAGSRLIPLTDGKWSFTQLRSINFLLNSENAKNFRDAQIRDKYMGLARFFRAYFYFTKVQDYGDVPFYNIVIETNDNENLYKARDPRALVMDSVLADINFAIEKLDATKSVERVTKWTALALKSRICLYEGTWRKYHTEASQPDAEKWLNECVLASEQLMQSGMYKVYTKTDGPSKKPYQDLFATLKLDGVADEVILGRRYSNELNVKHNLQFYLTARSQGKPGLEKRLVNSYLMADGSRFTDIPGYDTLQFFQEVQNRDPRLSQTIRTPGYTRIGGTEQLAPDFTATMTGYHPIKWMNVTTYDGNSQSVNDMVIFRFGEVLLNYAEAKAELGTITQGDIDLSIKLLRDRIGMPNLNMANANANPDPYQAALYTQVNGVNKGLILEIRRERRIEMVMESNLRWEDLMRWKEGQLLTAPFMGMFFPRPGLYDLDRNGRIDVEIYAGNKPPETGPYQIPVSDLSNGNSGNVLTNKGVVKTFDPLRDYFWPLPTQDLTLNPKLEQNPYWK
ncbi:RagB/SusD family nutrient uptake outer membrane protein [Chitinophaga horti]|uniref:RagB/SusD family nutrient uptake outer membrane protein n=1 Tax=Chitinophaga horti TaxID=2920382 RepID=A0ABY6IX16_9BACT|nr:RagB/SusD family nutrient uptake outer membrane protein [Chitinophaga horti]UYQ91923.1 RagB/SusD family nutrient uptake outer membrane protein [Chitinophaga horti]